MHQLEQLSVNLRRLEQAQEKKNEIDTEVSPDFGKTEIRLDFCDDFAYQQSTKVLNNELVSISRNNGTQGGYSALSHGAARQDNSLPLGTSPWILPTKNSSALRLLLLPTRRSEEAIAFSIATADRGIIGDSVLGTHRRGRLSSQ